MQKCLFSYQLSNNSDLNKPWFCLCKLHFGMHRWEYGGFFTYTWTSDLFDQPSYIYVNVFVYSAVSRVCCWSNHWLRKSVVCDVMCFQFSILSAKCAWLSHRPGLARQRGLVHFSIRKWFDKYMFVSSSDSCNNMTSLIMWCIIIVLTQQVSHYQALSISLGICMLLPVQECACGFYKHFFFTPLSLNTEHS